MNGETNLRTLLATMQPVLHEAPYIFCTVSRDIYVKLSFEPLCTFHEQEGVTVIATQEQARASGLEFDALWACITLNVNSSLTAVGFLAAITARLAQAGISVNAVSAYYHDHLFVPWESRNEVMQILAELNRTPK
jgi:uncharacterized protein